MADARPQQTDPPTFRQMFHLWLPLAASIVMMVLEPSTINIGLGRTTVVDCRVDPAEQVFPMIPAGAAALDMLEHPGADTTVEARAL